MSKRGLVQIKFLEISKGSFKKWIPKIKTKGVKYASITFQKQLPWFTNLNLSCRNFVAANLKNRLFSILSSYLILTVNHVPNKNKNENNKNCIKEARLERSYMYLLTYIVAFSGIYDCPSSNHQNHQIWQSRPQCRKDFELSACTIWHGGT